MILTKTVEWGVQQYGATLIINDLQSPIDPHLPLFIDVETDEKDNFVGIGFTSDGKLIYYLSNLAEATRFIQNYFNSGGIGLIGHNIKFDAKLLLKWGISLTSENLVGDTILMSYALNSTKNSHSLKELGKELDYNWPTYKEMVGSGRKKITLDKQEIKTVANYCGMDVFVTYQLYKNLKRKFDVFASRVYGQIEFPLMRILLEMELQGVLIDEEKLRSLNNEFRFKLSILTNNLKQFARKEFNPNSNKQVADILERCGISLPTTPKGNKKVNKFVLERFKDNEFVKILLEYNKLEKLVSTYTGGLLERKTLPRVCPTYNQISRINTGDDKGIATGRLSCSDPNLQQIPTRTEEGKLIRELFIPKQGYTLIDADYSQIEYRLLAHFTKEPLLLKAFEEEKDIHEETGKALGVDRETGKTLNFASIYGAGSKKIAQTAKCTEEEAQNFINKYWSVLPKVTSWVNQVKYQAKQQGGVFTFMKRWIPLPGLFSSDLGERFHWERCAVNFIIQGSAAEIMKLAMIHLRAKGLLPILTVHDELLYECEKGMEKAYSYTIKQTMESVVKLDIPLIVDIGVGENWRITKES